LAPRIDLDHLAAAFDHDAGVTHGGDFQLTGFRFEGLNGPRGLREKSWRQEKWDDKSHGQQVNTYSGDLDTKKLTAHVKAAG
jgi:hypothetical protein